MASPKNKNSPKTSNKEKAARHDDLTGKTGGKELNMNLWPKKGPKEPDALERERVMAKDRQERHKEHAKTMRDHGVNVEPRQKADNNREKAAERKIREREQAKKMDDHGNDVKPRQQAGKTKVKAEDRKIDSLTKQLEGTRIKQEKK